jgi:hypothetical protein
MALAADDRGRLHLTFRDPDRNGLHLLSEPLPDDREQISPGGLVSGDQWQVTLIDDGTQSPQSCSSTDDGPRRIGVNPNMLIADARLNVVYHDPSCGDLRHAYRSTSTQASSSSGWSIELVDTEDRQADETESRGLGRFSDITTNPQGELAIAYSDGLRGRLLYAVRRGQLFEPSTVDRGSRLGAFSQQRKHLVGAYVDLEFSADGTPLIAYMDATDNRVRLARRPANPGDWLHQSIEFPKPNGFYNALVQTNNRWHIYTERKVPNPQGLGSRLLGTALEVRP